MNVRIETVAAQFLSWEYSNFRYFVRRKVTWDRPLLGGCTPPQVWEFSAASVWFPSHRQQDQTSCQASQMLPDRLYVLKGQCHEFIGFRFFHDWFSGPLIILWAPLSFVFKLTFRSQIRIPWQYDSSMTESTLSLRQELRIWPQKTRYTTGVSGTGGKNVRTVGSSYFI